MDQEYQDRESVIPLILKARFAAPQAGSQGGPGKKLGGLGPALF